MKYYHRFSHAYARMHVLIGFLGAIAAAVASFAVMVFNYGIGNTWHMLRAAGVTAFRKISSLKPVYRESYDTHGLSFGDGQMRC